MNRKELYMESQKHSNNVNIDPSLCAYTPRDVYYLLRTNKAIHQWFKIIGNHFFPNDTHKKVLLLYPCTSTKPIFKARSYRMLYKTLYSLKEYRKFIHLITISEPFGLIPEEFYNRKGDDFNWKDTWYDVPGLFEWWVKKHKLPYEREFVDKSIEIIASNVAEYLRKTKNHYIERIAFVRTYSSSLKKKFDHTHRRIIERASDISGIRVKLLPSRNLVRKIVAEHGRFAWDMYGVAHPDAQEYLRKYLIKILRKHKIIPN